MRKGIHGEVLFVEGKLPEMVKKITTTKAHYIVGESETHGNDHRVAVMDGVELFEDQTGTLWIRNEVETDIYCPNTDRHDTVKLPAGDWQVGHAKEFDYLANKERVVRD